MSEKTKIKFTKNYTPRKKGEVVELEAKVAEFYLNNGVAEISGETEKKGGCEGCNKTEKLEVELNELKELYELKINELEVVQGVLTEKEELVNSLKADLKKVRTELTKATKPTK